MSMHRSEDENESAYAVVVVAGAEEAGEIETTYRSGLSHAAAMRLAEELQDEGKIVRVMHVTPHGRFEVDRYPLR
jgi:hypothetical protein